MLTDIQPFFCREFLDDFLHLLQRQWGEFMISSYLLNAMSIWSNKTVLGSVHGDPNILLSVYCFFLFWALHSFFVIAVMKLCTDERHERGKM